MFLLFPLLFAVFFYNVVFIVDKPDPNANPFKMPPDDDIFLLRDKERQQKKQVGQENEQTMGNKLLFSFASEVSLMVTPCGNSFK